MDRRLTSILLLVAVVLVTIPLLTDSSDAAGQSGSDDPTSDEVTFYGYVSNLSDQERNTPLAGVNVTLYVGDQETDAATVTTDEDGRFEFQTTYSPDGTYYLLFSYDGYTVRSLPDLSMSMDEEGAPMMVMDSTKISDVVKPGCMELEYVYDFFNNKYFRVEFAGRYDGDSSTVLPLCLYCEGDIPEQCSYDESGDDWSAEPLDDYDDYDDSFMEEFDNGGYEDEEDDGRGGYDEDGYSRGGIRYESLDDYIDKI